MSLFIIIGIVTISGCINNHANSSPINASNFTVTSDSYVMWNVDGEISPNNDLNCLEMVNIWYDSSGTVIDRDPLAWNINGAEAGQTF